ncbi:DNA replication and repair protein RecR [Allopseudospirillum japonicum]|uniref:Recombination protein RecR n=1 Tax=Allopseudospirillum japonicum TaxID=64971 RepID=A0A1H6QPK8_9GAMM|nr:recombination mediator RecR [Allopseudospirillum japonicum]SEI41380.1 DNA replication and repair protein RecR [Allopseudospirillum japonicum]
MRFSPLIDQLMQALRCLPGVGPKSAQRMALHLLERDPQGAQHLIDSLQQALDKVDHCQQCRTLSETPLCPICADPRRDASLLCVVETPADLWALEQTQGYQGYYFVLLGRLSPLEGIGPDDLGLAFLLQRLQQASIQELILATNPTLEGDTTAQYIALRARNLKRPPLKITRLAHGVPLGGELEYLDGGTLVRAFSGRQVYTDT